jgi:hypothetical protein
MSDEGWWVNVDRETPGYMLYLQYIYPLLNKDLRSKLRERVRSDDKITKIGLDIIWIKRIPTVSEQLLGLDKVEERWIDGRRIEIHPIPYKINSSLKEVELMVANVKNKIYEDLKKEPK